MSWKVRSVLVLAAAVAIYALVAWMISSTPGPTQQELEGRVAALESAQDLVQQEINAALEARSSAGRGTGSLHDTLQANLQTGRALLMNWTQDQVVEHLGWPDDLHKQRWGYVARWEGDRYLQLIWNDAGKVTGVLWFDEAPSDEE